MRRRRAFTLVELLVVVTIIAMLAALVLGSLHAAQNAAKEAHTKSTIAKIDSVFIDVWEQFQCRRLPTQPRMRGLVSLPPPAPGEPPISPRDQMEAAKWNQKRDLWRIEMPDRWPDVLGPTLCLPTDYQVTPMNPTQPGYTITCKNPLQQAYRRQYAAALQRLIQPPQQMAVEDAVKLLNKWEQGETLYMAVMAHGGNKIKWSDRETSDRDNDGLKEFCDGWGLPLMWLRWPAGWPGEEPGPIMSSARGIIGLGPYPLVMSAGRDGLYDVNRGVEPGGATYAYGLDFAGNLNPWTLDENSPPTLIGSPIDATGPGGEAANGDLDHFDNPSNKPLD